MADTRAPIVVQEGPSAWAGALLCALAPGACVARAVSDAGSDAVASAEAAGARARDAVASAGAAASGMLPTAAGVADVIRATAAPVSETASAVRTVSIAVTIGIVALVILGLVIAWKV